MNKGKNLYIKELVSPLEIFPYKQVIKKLLLIKSKYLKKWIKKVIKIIIRLNYEFYCFKGKIKIEEFANNILCILPIKKNNYESKYILELVKKVDNIVKKENIDNVIVSEKLKGIEEINKAFVDDSLIEGKYLLKIMIDNVIEYISHLKNQRIENQTVSIFVNIYSRFNLELIKLLAYKVKSVNIVTNSLRKFLIFEKRLYEDDGIMITVSSNKRRSVSKANWIINIDFSEEELKQYNINRTAIFINLVEKQFKISKAFSGIIINGMEIKDDFNKDLFLLNGRELFNQTILYESIIWKGESFEKIRKKVMEDGIKINALIGINGVLEDGEYTKIA